MLVIKDSINKNDLGIIAQNIFGDMIKAVVDKKRIIR